MAHPRSEKQKSIGRGGHIIELEDRLTDVVRDGFTRGSQDLRHMESPHEYVNANPNEVDLPDLPSCFVWCDGFDSERPTIGNMKQSQGYQSEQARNSKHSRHLEFYMNIHYFRSRLDTEEASRELRKVGWYLYEQVDDDLSLGNLMLRQPSMESTDFHPRSRVSQGSKIQRVSSFKMSLIYRTVDRD